MQNWQKYIDRAKKHMKLLAVDYDGTLFDGSHSSLNHQAAAALLLQPLHKGIHVVIISARDASFRKDVIPLLQPFVRKGVRCYFGGANGTYLRRIRNDSQKKIYNFQMNDEEIKNILHVYDKCIKMLALRPEDYSTNGINSFTKFLTNISQWSGFIPKKLLKLSLRYRGAMFIERSKISCVFPKRLGVQKSFLRILTQELGEKYNIKGDKTFTHISKKIFTKGKTIDNKLFAMQTVMKELFLSKKEVISLGDAPNGNDAAMLKYPEISFTNDSTYSRSGDKPPFFISGNERPVEKIHRIIKLLVD